MEILCMKVGFISANCYLVWDDNKNAVVIDPGFDFTEIKNKIRNLSLNVQKIIFTHGHFDHVGAALDLMNYLGCEVLVHSDEMMVIDGNIDLVGTNFKTPVVTKFVNDGDIIICGNLNFRVIHTPGHTKGGICLYIDNVLFSGDTIFKNHIGRCDFPTGNINQIVNSIVNKIFILPDDTVIYPGHHDKTTIGQEKKTNEVYKWL